ncbi:Tubulin-specific chaperone E [Vanrija pseudolonga]|uniref:Tubulin-specific chaperone E n=1 Tax=Vanrija pseudolonga TaxID=143232 RepID=A0AAF1BM50_9TREE|nr:Tubulin-specific chaperone E [Vanrija pseudolonga]
MATSPPPPPGPSSPSSIPCTLNGRYLNAKTSHPLTIKYIGPLPPNTTSATTWFGVEYDDPANGKGHDGVYRGEQVFRARQAGAGAFIKYAPGVLLAGSTLVDAVQERYGPLVPGQEEAEVAASAPGADDVVLGSSNAAIVVEAPNLDGVRKRIGQLERRKEIGFEGEWVASLGGSAEQRRVFKERLAGVRTLDLSRNLVSTWSEMADIVAHLTGLRSLILNHSRTLCTPDLDDEQRAPLRQVFGNITELHLGNAALSWAEALDIASVFPNLEVLFLNDNALLSSLERRADQDVAACLPKLKTLSLDNCPLGDWAAIGAELVHLPSLEALNLSGVPVSTIPSPTSPPFIHLTRLVMSDSRLAAWRDIDELNQWTSGKLEHLRISFVPRDPAASPVLISGDARVDRSFLIAKLSSLTTLNGSQITYFERTDAELYYLHAVDRIDGPKSEWGQYDDLQRKHGQAEKLAPVKPTNLKSKMMNIHVIPPSGETLTLRLLRTAQVAVLKKRVAKQMHLDAVAIFTARPALFEGMWEPVEEMDEGVELGMWLSDGDTVLAVV